MVPRESDGFEALVERAAWMKRLARELVRDPHAADDLVQEAWVAALERPPEPGTPVQRWFAAVMRNFARDRWRANVRRRATERESARPERSRDEALERLDAHALLVDAVRALDEPYRTTLVLRYLDELSPAEVAARTGVPLRTVHTRTTRALEKLRERLDRSAGDRAKWLGALVPLLGHPATPYLGALFVNAKWIGAAAAAIVLSAAGWWTLSKPDAAGLELAEGVAAPQPDVELVHATEPSPERSDVGTPDEPHPPTSTAPKNAPNEVARQPDVAGIVIDPAGTPLAGLEVELVRDVGVVEPDAARELPTNPRLRTDALGRFSFVDPPHQGRMRVATPGWVTVYEPRYLDTTRDTEWTVVAAPAIAVRGRVVDDVGEPVAAAKVGLGGVAELRSTLERVLDGSPAGVWRTESDADGRFEFAELPLLPGGRLEASSPGYRASHVAVPPESTDDIVLTLARGAFVLAGHVQLRDGRPAVDAWVALGDASTTTDADGNFRLEPTKELPQETAQHALVLRAATKGWQPVRLACAAQTVDAPGGWPDPLVLTFTDETLAIRGRVLDVDGHPVPNASVRIVDGESAGMREHVIGNTKFYMAATFEGLAAGREYEGAERANELGEFELSGLQARSYILRVDDARTLATLETAPIRAGTHDVELRLASEKRVARIAGQVVSVAGSPVRDEIVRVQRITSNARGEPYTLESESVTCDAEGRFEFHDVAADATSVRADFVVLPLAGADLENLRIVVPQPVHVRIECNDRTPDADTLYFVDSDEQLLPIVVDHGDVSFSAQRWQLQRPRSDAFQVRENATALVLEKGGQEILRLPVKLVPGELNVLRP
ncbi:MAG: sigma-70 family RNA polymerase sigma factor [Planctomycetes bacterium]|nr:sigma-70 family RNA polymerase sigma factor [Planctomycetota bacterium]